MSFPLEGIKDALYYKIQKDHNWSELQCNVHTNKGGHRDAFSNEQHETLHISKGLFSWQLSLK